MDDPVSGGDPLSHGFCAGASFTEPATSQDKPVPPIPRWLNLLRPSKEFPIIQELLKLRLSQLVQDLLALGSGQECQRF